MNAITMPTCFRPYPGELLYSWIIRLYNSNGYPTVYKMYLMVCRHVFGTMKGERKNDFIRRTISFSMCIRSAADMQRWYPMKNISKSDWS